MRSVMICSVALLVAAYSPSAPSAPQPSPTPTPGAAGDSAYARGEIARQIGACGVLTTRARLAAMGEHAADFDKNLLTLRRSGEVSWNSLIVDDVTLQQYLEQSASLPTKFWLVFEPETGVDAERLYAVQKIIVASGICGE